MYHFLCGRLVLFLIGIVAVLQIIHVVLLNRLESHQITNSRSPQPKPSNDIRNADGSLLLPENEVEDELSSMVAFVEKSWVLDASGEYHISSLLPGSNGAVDTAIDVTLATHCSHDHLSDILPLLQQWKGPISLAVFASPNFVWYTLHKMANLRVSHSAVRLNVTFSLVWPISVTAGLPLQSSSNKNVVSVAQNYNNHDAYPNNLLRNTARKSSFSDFVFVIDIDMMPMVGLRQNFLNYMNHSRLQRDTIQDKTVFVVPSFEGDILPSSKSDLIRAVEAGKIRPFYSQLCWKCQAHTDYESWLHWPSHELLLVIYDVLWKDPWEPFYISHNTVPFYDERFKQYGFNRISQVCELHVSGYKFSVLNNAFLVHRGFKTASSFHARKEEELELNRLLYRQFKSELKYKYAESSRRCY